MSERQCLERASKYMKARKLHMDMAARQRHPWEESVHLHMADYYEAEAVKQITQARLKRGEGL